MKPAAQSLSLAVSQPAPFSSNDPNWMDQLARQLDQTIEMISSELAFDEILGKDDLTACRSSDPLQVTEFPIEEFDWADDGSAAFA